MKRVLLTLGMAGLVALGPGCSGGSNHDGQDAGADADGGGGDDAGLDGDSDPGDDAGLDGDSDAGGDGDAGGDEGPRDPDCEGVSFAPCTPLAGSNGATLLKGTVLTPDELICDGEILIDRASHRIACVAEDCSAHDLAAEATVLCAGIITPGLIDTHNHMTYNTVPPWRHPGVLYEHRQEWLWDDAFNAYDARLSGSAPDRYSELRLLMSGTTSVHKSSPRSATFTGVRNLDRAEDGNQLGLPDSAITECVYPLEASCDDKPDYENPDPDLRTHIVHLCEGIDQTAYQEFRAFLDDGQLGDRTAIIHGISFDGQQMALVASSGATFIWSPQTNIDLYGVTADVTAIRNMGVEVALAPDWTISGTMNLMAELKCADHLNQKYYDSFFSAKDLLSMVTVSAARVLRIDDLIGSLEPDHFADVMAVNGDRRHPYEAVVQMRSADVRAVFVGGEAFYGDVDALNPDIEFNPYCEDIEVCGADKRICVKQAPGEPAQPLDEDEWALWRYADYLNYLQGELDQLEAQDDPPPEDEYLYSLLPLFECDPHHWCEMGNAHVPGEPTAQDADGDGVLDAGDNCAAVFNPNQGDLDGDGSGDACDPCPTAQDPTDCPAPDPDDRDADGVPNLADNCPLAHNADQADEDGDGDGDACDACPAIPNPDGAPCPATIYDIKTGVYSPGDPVTLADVLVTGVTGATGFFAQVPGDHPAYAGVDWSGIYVYTGGFGPDVAPGDRLDVQGQVADYHGQTEISAVTGLAIQTQGDPPPGPEPVTPAEIAMGGARADALEGVLCEVSDVVVSRIEIAYNEWQVDDGLWIGDFLFADLPLPSVGDRFSTIRGILHRSYGDNVLEPRGAADLVAGPVSLSALQPALSFAYTGQTAEPLPSLEVILTGPALSDREVSLLSSDPGRLQVPATITVPLGQDRSPLVVTGLAASGDLVTITAGLEGLEATAQVRVLDGSEQPVLDSLDPAALTLGVDGTGALTAGLDIPARPGGESLTVSASPGTAISVPATVVVPEGDLSVDIPVTPLAAAGVETVTVSLGGSVRQATIEVVDAPVTGLILAQVYYDHPSGDDGTEWVQLYNGTADPIDLGAYSLGYGGTDYTYGRYQLQGTIAPFACFIAGGPTADATNGEPTFDQVVDFDPDMQNSGSTADAVALFDVPAAEVDEASVPIDAVIYGGSNTNDLLDESGNPGPVDAPDCAQATSLQRLGPDTWGCQDPPLPADCPAF